MKKLNGKFVVSAIIAAAMLSFSAGAISYGGGTTPVTPTPTKPAATTTTGEVDGTSADNPAEVLTDSAVDKALESGEKNVVLYMEETSGGSAIVQESAIAEIAKALADGKVDSVTVDVKTETGLEYAVSISNINEVKSLDLGMNILVGQQIAALASQLNIPVPAEAADNAIIIAPNAHGDFGMTLTITLPAAALGNVDLENAVLYYIADDGTVTVVDGALVPNADGSVSISLTHASAYVISDIDLVAAAAMMNADIDDDDDDLDFDDDDDDDDDDDGFTLDDDDDDDFDDDDESNDISNDDKDGDEPIVISNEESDSNPGTGVTLAIGALAASAAAVLVTAKKRK